MAYRYNSNHQDNNRSKKRLKRFFGIVTVLMAVLLILCAYAGKFNPEKFFPAPFLTLAYMPMLLLSALVLVIALVCRRFKQALILILAFFATWPVFSMYVPLNHMKGSHHEPGDTTQVIKVMTYNVLSFNYNDPTVQGKDSKSMKLILDADPDVVMLQEGGAAGVSWMEIPSLQPYIERIKTQFPYTYSSAEGLNLLSKFPFTTMTLGEPQYTRTVLGYNRETDYYLARAYDIQLPMGKQLRFIDFRLQSYHLNFGKNMNIRISPDVKPVPLERMKRAFSLRSGHAQTIRKAIDESPRNVIICGDMNDVTTSNVYRIIKGDDMTDAWAQVGHGYAYTFNRHNLPFRIDHILYRGDLQALGAQRLKGGSSDHYPLLVTFDLNPTDN